MKYAKLMKEYEDMKAAGNGQSEEFEEKEKGWKKTIEEIFSLIKKLLGKTSGQKMEKDSEERLNEISRSQGSDTKQPNFRVKQQYEALLKKHALEYTKSAGEYEEITAAGNGKTEGAEAKEKAWKKMIEEMFSLMKELTRKTSGQNVEKNFAEALKEVLQSQGMG